MSDNGKGSSTKRKRNPSESSNQDDKLLELAANMAEVLGPSTILSAVSEPIVQLLRPALKGVLRGDLHESTLRILKLRFPVVVDDEPTRATIALTNDNLDQLSKLYQSRLEYANALPPPSSYARHSTWAEWQQKSTANLCSRPSDKQGLPLCVLDNAFREFQQQAMAPLPSTEDARKAMNAAFDLCNTTPDHFALESDRGNAFDECLDPILPLSGWRKEVSMSAPTDLFPGVAGRIYERDGIVCILREDKVETGTGEMRTCKCHAFTNSTSRRCAVKSPRSLSKAYRYFFSASLVGVAYIDTVTSILTRSPQGPILLICGGFYDTKSTIVEPLVEPCLMFDDYLHTRREALARQLFALKQALVNLCSRSWVDGDTVNHHPAGVPRVYPTYTAEDNAKRSLTFLRPLNESPHQPLLFIAAEDPPDSSNNKLVKLVVRKYGVGVHRLLAERQLAPMLYGQSSLEGAPTAYVMEFLSPPTFTPSGWVTLFEFFKSKKLAARYSNAIRIALDRILKVMEEANMVHGDFRPNNVMLEVNQDNNPVCLGEEQGANLKVVDFDWAGESGKVCYPLQRNEDIDWPGDAGAPIIVGHDRALVTKWWSEHFFPMS